MFSSLDFSQKGFIFTPHRNTRVGLINAQRSVLVAHRHRHSRGLNKQSIVLHTG